MLIILDFKAAEHAEIKLDMKESEKEKQEEKERDTVTGDIARARICRRNFEEEE